MASLKVLCTVLTCFTVFFLLPHRGFSQQNQLHQWSLNAAASNDGVMNQPMIGEFRNGRGEFYDQEPYHNKAIWVRQVWSDITPTSHRFEQAISNDGGKTWEVNFIANLERVN